MTKAFLSCQKVAYIECVNALWYYGQDDETIKNIIDWIKKNSTVLENGFFHYESKDKKFAEKVSATLYVFERI
jgi:hypothetical protein